MSIRAEGSEADFWGDADESEALQRYRSLVNAVSDGIYQLDAAGRFVAVNDAIVEMTGYERERLIGEPASVLLDEGDVDRIEREIQRRLTGAESHAEPLELTARTADGDAISCELELQLLVENGTFQGTIGVVRDVTDREPTERAVRERERELHRKERRYEAIFEDPNILVGLLEPDGTVLDINQTAMEYIDADLEEVTGKPFWKTPWWGEGDTIRDDVREWTERASDGDYVDFEADLTRPNGEQYTLNGYFRPVTNDDGDVVSIIVSDRDVTERREYRRKLEEREHRYRALVENFPDGAVALFDDDLEYTAVGGQYFDDADIEPDERIGNSVFEIYPDDLVTDLEPNFRATLDGEEREFAVEYNDRYLRLHTVPVRDATGEIDAGMIVAQDVTERREYRRKLEESEAKFRMVAENLDEIVWMTSSDIEEFLYVNPAYETIFGQDRESVYEDPYAFGKRIHPEDRERVLEEWNKLPDVPYEEEFRVVRPDGETRWVHAQATRIHDESGDVTRVVGIANDVTERKERERELERALDLLEKTERIADVAGWAVDPETSEPYWSDHLFDLLDVDYTEQPSIDQALDVYYTEADREIVADAIEEALETGEPFDVEARFPRPAGDVGWLRVKGDPEVEDGEVVSLRGAVQDVTERKEREQALQESRNQLRALIDVLPVAVFVAEADGEIVEWNEAGEEIWGGKIAESESVAEYDRYEAWWADTNEPVEPDEWPLARALEGEEVTDPDEIRIKGFDGEYRTVLNHGMPVRDANGDVSRAVVTLVDITERKEYQRKLEESNERLEQFAYAVSHDLQEPLRMVSSYLQLLENRYEDDLDEDGREFIEFAVDGADRMKAMIEGLLEYSRVETRGDPLEPVDLDAILDDVLADLQFQIEETAAEITADDLPRVDGDASQLRQVFQNLLDNAIEYSGDEPPRIHVSAERDGSAWRISVRDEGIGIDPDDQDRIFEVFQRLHSRGEHAGTGIGLALCERIVERHGGEIWVDSAPGEGTTFSFTLPASGGQ